MPRHHTVISGTGRTGTTFLMQLFTRLGLGTGYNDAESHISPHCNAGMEWDIRDPEAPYIVKNPWLCDCLDSVLESGNIVIDHAIIPMRDLFSAAQSRRDVALRTDPGLYAPGEDIAGGLWHTDEPEKQEIVLAGKFYGLLYALTKRNIPTTLLYFPVLIHDPDYLYGKLKFLMPETDYDFYLSVFKETARPELVHDF